MNIIRINKIETIDSAFKFNHKFIEEFSNEDVLQFNENVVLVLKEFDVKQIEIIFNNLKQLLPIKKIYLSLSKQLMTDHLIQELENVFKLVWYMTYKIIPPTSIDENTLKSKIASKNSLKKLCSFARNNNQGFEYEYFEPSKLNGPLKIEIGELWEEYFLKFIKETYGEDIYNSQKNAWIDEIELQNNIVIKMNSKAVAHFGAFEMKDPVTDIDCSAVSILAISTIPKEIKKEIFKIFFDSVNRSNTTYLAAMFSKNIRSYNIFKKNEFQEIFIGIKNDND